MYNYVSIRHTLYCNCSPLLYNPAGFHAFFSRSLAPNFPSSHRTHAPLRILLRIFFVNSYPTYTTCAPWASMVATISVTIRVSTMLANLTNRSKQANTLSCRHQLPASASSKRPLVRRILWSHCGCNGYHVRATRSRFIYI